MNFETLFTKTLDVLLLPPGFNILLMLVGLIILKRQKLKLAIGIFITSIISLFIFSLPIVSNSLNNKLQSTTALSPNQVKSYSVSDKEGVAIVVLSGGRISQAAEYGDIDTVSALTLQRLQYAAWLHKKTLFPILVSGGSVFDEPTAEAVLMNQTMLSLFNIAPKWIEGKSKNTAQNAEFSVKLLKQYDISEILLVTHANHMPRALQEFRRYNLKITPAPTAFKSPKNSWMNYLPSATALFESQQALHEELGQIWYKIGG